MSKDESEYTGVSSLLETGNVNIEPSHLDREDRIKKYKENI